MDHQTTINELKEHVKKFCEDRDWTQYHTPKDLAIGIITEAAELLEHFRFKNDNDIATILQQPEKKEAINDELADTLYMILRLAQMHNIDLTTALINKLKKNEQKYPVEKCKGINKKYTEY